MPFLRVVRDKRGYETTYLIHADPGKGSRVLYVFRSPGGVRVGREPFEPELRHLIEAGHPELTFDWNALLSSRQVIDTQGEPRRAKRRSGTDAAAAPSPPRRVEQAHQQPRLVVPNVVEGETPEARMRFLAHWHGILCEQLPKRIGDVERRNALMALVQRLNPAGWIDADEIAAGVLQAGEALENLSRMFSKRRRKGKRGAGRPEEGGATTTPGSEPVPRSVEESAPDSEAAGRAGAPVGRDGPVLADGEAVDEPFSPDISDHEPGSA